MVLHTGLEPALNGLSFRFLCQNWDNGAWRVNVTRTAHLCKIGLLTYFYLRVIVLGVNPSTYLYFAHIILEQIRVQHYARRYLLTGVTGAVNGA